jgi:PAS domain-containing protein
MGTGGLLQDWVASFTRVPRALTPPALWSLIDGVGRSVGLFGPETEAPSITIQEVPEALLIARSDGRVALANARAAALFGRGVGELADMPLDALFRVSRSKNGDDAFELLGARQNGDEFYADVHAHILSTQAPGDTVIAVVRDVTARHTAERRHGPTSGGSASRSIPARSERSKWTCSRARRFGTSVRTGCSACRPGAFRGTIEAFLELVHSDDRAKVADFIMRATQEAEPFELDFRAVLPNGSTRYMSSRADVIRDERGRAARIAGVVTDVTERVNAQLRLQRAHDDLERRVSERTEDLNRSIRELDDFAQIVSHDLKEPLRGIYNYARFIMEDEEGKLGDDARQKARPYLVSREPDERPRGLHPRERPYRPSQRRGRASTSDGRDRRGDDARRPACRGQREGAGRRWIPGRGVRSPADRGGVPQSPDERDQVQRQVGETDRGRLHERRRTASPVFFVRDNGIGIEPGISRPSSRCSSDLHGRDAFGGGTGPGWRSRRRSSSCTAAGCGWSRR